MDELGQGIWHRLADEQFRHRFTAESVAQQLAHQTKMLRISRGVSVADLATAIDCSTSDIEMIESGQVDDVELDLLLSIAAHFDVAMVARFIPFSEAIMLGDYVPSLTETDPPEPSAPAQGPTQ